MVKEDEFEIVEVKEKRDNLSGYIQGLSEEERASFYAMRARKASQTRKENNRYAKAIQKACQALSEGEFNTVDGVNMTGAEILAINCFERAKYSDKSLQTFIRLTGDYNGKEEEEENSYEKFIEDTKVVWE